MRIRLFHSCITTSLLLAGLVLAFGTPASAGSIFRWTTDEGVIAFADDAKRIPARYRDAAERIVVSGIEDYARYTPDRVDFSDHAGRLQARLERLRQLNFELDRAAAHERAIAASRNAGFTLSLAGPGQTRFDVGNNAGDEPVVVESVRVRPAGRLATHHNQVVRQGDRVLAIVRGTHDQQFDPGEYVPERELLP